jgi:hypothetical protein
MGLYVAPYNDFSWNRGQMTAGKDRHFINMVAEDKITEKYCYGQMMIRRKKLSGKCETAYIVTHTAGYDTLVKMSTKFPFDLKTDDYFFVHEANLKRLWHHAKEGVQLSIYK